MDSYLVRVVVKTRKTGKKMSYAYHSTIADIQYHVNAAHQLHSRHKYDLISVSVVKK